jgi:hypothetical protein
MGDFVAFYRNKIYFKSNENSISGKGSINNNTNDYLQQKIQ